MYQYSTDDMMRDNQPDRMDSPFHFAETDNQYFAELVTALLAIPAPLYEEKPAPAPVYAIRACRCCGKVAFADTFGFSQPGVCNKICISCQEADHEQQAA